MKKCYRQHRAKQAKRHRRRRKPNTLAELILRQWQVITRRKVKNLSKD